MRFYFKQWQWRSSRDTLVKRMSASSWLSSVIQRLKTPVITVTALTATAYVIHCITQSKLKQWEHSAHQDRLFKQKYVTIQRTFFIFYFIL